MNPSKLELLIRRHELQAAGALRLDDKAVVLDRAFGMSHIERLHAFQHISVSIQATMMGGKRKKMYARLRY